VLRTLSLVLALSATSCAAQALPAETASKSDACQRAIAMSDADRGLAVLVLKDGEPVCSSPRPTLDQPHELWSGTKSFLGIMAAIAAKDGLLSLDEPAAATLTEWQDDPQREKITLRHLLSMTSGHKSRVGRPPGYGKAVASDIAAPPGSKFLYGPVPSQIFGEVMRLKLQAYGKSGGPKEYLEEHLFAPLGIEDYSWRNGPDKQPLMPQGVVMSARDWAKFGEFVRSGGQIGGTQIVDPDTFEALFEGGAANAAYGLSWWLPRPSQSKDAVTATTDIDDYADLLPADMVVAAGAGNQRLYVIPSLGVTIVRLAELDLAAALRGDHGKWSDYEFIQLALEAVDAKAPLPSN